MSSLYYYTARNAEGRSVRGVVDGPTQASALGRLRTRALFITSLVPSNSARGRLAHLTTHLGGASQTSLAALFRSLATLIEAGVPLRRALHVGMQQSRDPRLREALSAVSADVETGSTLSDAMARRPREFAPLCVAMIRAGEVGGVLDAVLERLAHITERERATRKRLGAALTYPAIVAAAAVVLTLFLMTSIVPMFASLYAQLHVELPAATAMLLEIGTGLRSVQSWAVLTGAVICATPLGLVLRTDAGQMLLDRYKLCVPIVGIISRKTALARLTRTLGSLLQSGVGLVQAIDVAADVAGNRAYALSLKSVRQALREGDQFAEPLRQSGLYDPLVTQMIAVGEETGMLDAMLLRIAEYYELDVEVALSTLGATLEPVLVVGLGGVVGFIVFSIFIPLYTLIGSIK